MKVIQPQTSKGPEEAALVFVERRYLPHVIFAEFKIEHVEVLGNAFFVSSEVRNTTLKLVPVA